MVVMQGTFNILPSSTQVLVCLLKGCSPKTLTLPGVLGIVTMLIKIYHTSYLSGKFPCSYRYSLWVLTSSFWNQWSSSEQDNYIFAAFDTGCVKRQLQEHVFCIHNTVTKCFGKDICMLNHKYFHLSFSSWMMMKLILCVGNFIPVIKSTQD